MRLTVTNLRLGLLTLAALLVVALAAPMTRAQLTRGAINGTVRDEAGAAVAGATVRVSDPTKNFSRETTTNEEGFYRVAALEPGSYTVTVQGAGFGTLENQNVEVRTSTDTTLDATLKAGGVSETVNVTAQSEAITINKTNATVGLTVTQRQVTELPLGAARNVNNLALLSPNVVSGAGSSGIVANGQRARNNNFTIDGTDNNDITITQPTVSVIPEAVGEFSIQTNPYSAEAGRNTGALINVNTKSGTNQFHGDFWDYYRGSRLFARSNLEKAAGLERPGRFNRNQFGFDIGGPVFLPGPFGEGTRKVGYDGRDRTFFFYLFQGDRARSGAQLGATIRIPTPAGFAALQNAPLGAGQSAASRQAVLNQLSFLSKVYGQAPVFRAGSVNSNTLVNGTGIETGQTNIAIAQPFDSYNNTLKLEHKIGNNDNLVGRYIVNKERDPNLISNLQFGPLFAGDQNVFDQNLQLSETHVFGPTVLNEARASYIRRNLGFPENDPNTPTATIGGFFTVGGSSNFPQGRITNYYQFADTLSWLAGNHALKFGLDIRRNLLKNISGFDTKGTFGFNNLQDFLNNNAATYTQAINAAIFNAKQIQQFYFVQDDWKVRPNLTLNMGLRYETSGTPFGFFGATDPTIQAALVPGPVRRDKNNFAPVFGFSYSPSPESGILKTIFGDGASSIRGGYRIAYDQLFFNILTVNAANFPITVSLTQTSVRDVYPNTKVGIAPGFNPLAGFVNSPENTVNPYSQLFSLSWQREIARNYVFEVGYTGSRSLNQINQMQVNPSILTPAQITTVQNTRNPNSIPSATARRLFPQFGSRTLITTEGQATYNAAYMTVNKRFSHGLLFNASYTYGKLISNTDESLNAGPAGNSPQIPQDFFNLNADKSVSGFDRRHRFVTNFLYEVPVPGFVGNNAFGRQVLGGWEISGIVTRQSGAPFTILTGVDTNGNGTATGDRPNFDPNGILRLDPVTGNFRSFTSPLVGGQFIVPLNANGLPLQNGLGNGNLGKNTFRTPGFYNTDLSFQKRFRMPWEGQTLIFRGDLVNAFNQDNYGRPVTNMNSADFGKNLNDWGQRTVTLSAKYSF